METNELAQIIESLLFVSTDPVPIDKITDVVGVEKKVARETLETLMNHYLKEDHGLKIVEIAGGYQMMTRPENSLWVKKLLAVKTSGKLSKPGLETLAIIAYKQPVIRTEIETIRGVDCGGVIKTLLERRLVKIVGRKEMPGRPILYGTTKEFLQYFGLKDIAGLPTLKEFKEDSFPLPENTLQSKEEHQVPDVEVIINEGN